MVDFLPSFSLARLISFTSLFVPNIPLHPLDPLSCLHTLPSLFHHYLPYTPPLSGHHSTARFLSLSLSYVSLLYLFLQKKKLKHYTRRFVALLSAVPSLLFFFSPLVHDSYFSSPPLSHSVYDIDRFTFLLFFFSLVPTHSLTRSVFSAFSLTSCSTNLLTVDSND